MVLETFYPRGAEKQGSRHGGGKKFAEPLAEQETFVPDLEVGGAVVKSVEKHGEKELGAEIRRLEDNLHAVLLREYLESGDETKADKLNRRLEIEKNLRESDRARVTDIFRNRKDCRSPGKTSSDEERLAAQSPHNQVMMVEI